MIWRCGTIKIPPCSKAESANQNLQPLITNGDVSTCVDYFPAVGKLRQTKPNDSLLQIKAYFALFFWELFLGKKTNP